MAEQVNGIGLDVDNGLFEVGAILPQAGSWSIGCDVTIEDVDASVQEVRVNDISLSGSLAIPEVSVDIDANNDKVMDLEIGIATSGLSTGITESQIVPYDKIVKMTEFSPESINERRFASSALAAKRIYDLIKEGGAGLNEDELKAFLKRYGYVTEEYVNELLKNVSSFFYLSEDGQSIGTQYNIFSEKEISANGLSVGGGGSGSGEGGGLIRTVLTSSSLGSVTSNDNFTTFNAFAIDSIYKKVKSIEEGNVSLSNYYTKSESDARFALLSSLTTVEEKIREILSWFTIDENGNLRTEFNLYSTKEISAGGFNGTGGSTGGGLISTVLGIDKFGTVTTNSNTATFNAYAIDSLHKRIKNLEESEVDLTGYATEEWVMGRGFITASALAPYLKTTDFETWKTSSFNPVVSQVNTNKNNIAEILKWFAIDGDGNLYTTYNFYSTKEISSGGFDSGSNGTGGLIGVVYGKSAFGTIANEVNNATFNAYAIDSLYKRIVLLENKEVDLTGYATESWVAGQGFITLAALSPYMKTADANDTFATKTALNNLSSSHDSLAKRVSTAEGNISTHTTQISGLTTRMGNAETNISTNAKRIADNKTAIATNKSNISANATAITNLGKKVTANEGNIAKILKWFAVDSDGNLYTTYNLYSTKEISANGLSIGSGGSGGGLISQVYGITAFGTIAAESNSATFNAYAIDSLYKRIVSLEGKATAVSFVPALTSGKQIGTLSIDGVSTVLYGVDSYSKADADGTFLKLSGGKVTGVVSIDTANSDIFFGIRQSGSDKSAFGWSTTDGTYMYSYKSSRVLGIKDDGTPFFGITSANYTLLHSGNYSQYALPLTGGTINGNTYIPLKVVGTSVRTSIGFSKDASAFAYLTYNGGSSWAVTDEYYNNEYTLIHSGNIGSQFVEGIGTTYANQSINMGAESRVRLISLTSSDSTDLGAPKQYVSGLSVMSNYVGWQLVSGASQWRNDDFYIRKIADNGAYLDWKIIAFTDSNVASATKLATARTIWGQSFDGTGNVSGTLYDVNNIYPNSAAERYIGTSSNPFKYVYAEWFGSAANSNLAFGANNAVHMVIKASGNVLVGTTTDTSGNKLQVNGTILSTPARESAYSSVLRGYQSGIVAGDRLSLVIGKESASKNAAYFGFTYDGSGSSKNFASIGFHSVDNILCVAATSYVGIGTTSPAYKLDVNGTLRATGAVTMDSTLNVGTVINVGSNIMPKTNETSYLGSTSLRFLAVCAKIGDFSGKVTANYVSVSYDGLRFSDNANYALFMDSSNKVNLSGYYGINLNGAVTMSSTLHVVDVSTFESYLNIQAGIRPNANDARYVGTSSYRFNEGYINNMYTNAMYVGKGTTYGFKSDGSINATAITANSGVKVASGHAITFLDASGKEHKLTYDSTAGAFKFDGNILVLGDGQFNAIN